MDTAIPFLRQRKNRGRLREANQKGLALLLFQLDHHWWTETFAQTADHLGDGRNVTLPKAFKGSLLTLLHHLRTRRDRFLLTIRRHQGSRRGRTWRKKEKQELSEHGEE